MTEEVDAEGLNEARSTPEYRSGVLMLRISGGLLVAAILAVAIAVPFTYLTDRWVQALIIVGFGIPIVICATFGQRRIITVSRTLVPEDTVRSNEKRRKVLTLLNRQVVRDVFRPIRT